jgi:hypothetical protein
MSNIPFQDTHGTGIKVILTESSGSDVTIKTDVNTEVLSGIRFLEPISGKFRKDVISEYGQQFGQMYLLYFRREDPILKKKMSKYTILMNLEEETRNLPFTDYTIVNGNYRVGENSTTLKILNIIDGTSYIDQRQAICVISS